ncbi:MAG: hypothetical protein U5J63_14840 [Fodinibius sp.]|nr:hypothetical protein [Fodinibius sp.]
MMGDVLLESAVCDQPMEASPNVSQTSAVSRSFLVIRVCYSIISSALVFLLGLHLSEELFYMSPIIIIDEKPIIIIHLQSQNSDDSIRVMLLPGLAMKLKDRGKVTETRKLLGQARAISKDISNVWVTEKVIPDFSDFYLSTDRPDSAIIVLERHLEKYPESNRWVNVLNLLGSAYQYQAEHKGIMLMNNVNQKFNGTGRFLTLFTLPQAN